MKKATFLTICLLGIFHGSHAYLGFNINNPRTGTWNGSGTIKNVQITVFPRGVYAEISLSFEVSAEGSKIVNESDTLEATLNFSLPNKALVIDSWLWIDDTTIVQGQHLDRWTATNIYENIVKRVRRDPSILTKNSYSNYYEGFNYTSYDLRIYPLTEFQKTRKAKITYLVPIQFDGRGASVSVSVPVDFANASKSVSGINLKLYENGPFSSPKATINDSLNYSYGTDQHLKYYAASIPVTYATQSERYGYYDHSLGQYFSKKNFPAFDIKYTNTYSGANLFYYPKNEDEGYFELAFKPIDILKTSKSKRVCIVLDYDNVYSSTSRTKLASEVSSFLRNELDSTDYFNIVFAGTTIKRKSDIWINATDKAIANAISDSTLFQSDSTGQEALFNNVIDFINDNDSSARVILITSNIKKYKADTAISINNRLIARMKTKAVIDIIDHYYFYYLESSGGSFVPYDPYSTIGGIRYYGNSFFYINLCKKTGGNFYEFRKSIYGHYDWYNSDFYWHVTNIIPNLRNGLNQIGGFLTGQYTAFDHQISIDEGFTYGKYYLQNPGAEKVSPLANYVVVGQYKGKFPLKLRLNGLLNGKPYSNEIKFDANDANKENSILERHWWGQFILSNETSYQAQTISEVVEASLKYRILSNYTAFLCLEPSLGGTVCKDCVEGIPYTLSHNTFDGGIAHLQTAFNHWQTGITSLPENDTLITEVIAFPNPANEHITFKIRNPKSELINIKVFNSGGILVKEIQLAEKLINTVFTWNLYDQNESKVSPGLYFVRVEIGKSGKSLKIMIE